ncbi:MAG: aspartate aminotransferase family protein [Liquorilactobacillus nagelii]|uniref:Aspartate aminotransferase family protein n=1 Tax=Liquorilactobacillus nagelii TaxID=82688 RepID=A0A3Q8CZL9_9LACO|nr:aspartate aminotransferase family protein [Liquorilactobacillus nagelii]AUJ32461.1 aspartate aminotransferase family protein [Liquorilactobacillus nagelii]KRL39966.1 4-aminobutyrate aminotransferase [Liquorilactobacillus nagelii DSM 13675]
MTTNKELLAAEAGALAKTARIKYFDIVIDSGKGALLKDVEGHTYLDLLASASSTNTGHAHPKVVAAIQQQAAKIIQYTPAYFANSPAAELAQKLADIAPISGPVKVAWGNSGSDANDGIIKFARAFTGRQYLVSFMGAYHGSTYGSLSTSAVSLNMARKIGPLLPGVVKVPYPDPWHRLPDESETAFVDRMFAAFLEPFKTYLPAEETAVIMMEPIQGDGGIAKAPTEFVKRVADFAHQHGILFAVDEVNQGLGRTGKMWSIQHFGIEPDLMSVGKSIASGLPLSAVVGRAEVMDSLPAPGHLFTTSGNPVTTAAALATLDVIQEENLPERSARLGKLAADFFAEQAEKHAFIGNWRMYGLDGGIDIVDPQTKAADPVATTKLIYRIFQLGAIMISLKENILRFQPPLVITEKQLQQAFAILAQAFAELEMGKLVLPENAAQIGW